MVIDASFVDVPRQRNSREENAQIKVGETPERFEANSLRLRAGQGVKSQKDTQVRWGRKNQETTLATRITFPSITNTS